MSLYASKFEYMNAIYSTLFTRRNTCQIRSTESSKKSQGLRDARQDFGRSIVAKKTTRSKKKFVLSFDKRKRFALRGD